MTSLGRTGGKTMNRIDVKIVGFDIESVKLSICGGPSKLFGTLSGTVFESFSNLFQTLIAADTVGGNNTSVLPGNVCFSI